MTYLERAIARCKLPYVAYVRDGLGYLVNDKGHIVYSGKPDKTEALLQALLESIAIQ